MCWSTTPGSFLTADIIESPLADWRRPFDIMVDGAVAMTRTAAPLMNAGGRIIHVTSIHGERVEARASAYAMAKAAINHYCRALALELRRAASWSMPLPPASSTRP